VAGVNRKKGISDLKLKFIERSNKFMVTRKNLSALILSSIMLALLLSVPSAFAQSNQLRVDYTVAVADVDKQLFHVTAEVKNIKEPNLTLSLPTWTPGWYTVENYAKNILRFKITDAQGNWVQPAMIKKQTWRVDTKDLNSLKIEFDYKASVLALNQAKITKDFAFFTGTQLFLEVVGHRNKPSRVRFEFPQGWKLMTSLKDTNDPQTFIASDYDTLVDATTEMGNFDAYPFQVEGKPHYFVATPAGTFSKEKAEKFTQMLAKTYAAQSAIFGGLPYEKQICFYFFARPESNAGGALEHLNSFVAFAPPGNQATPEMLIGTAAHEFFHVWNVKRIRPMQMWPYDYSRENETPLLWLSEGFTNYYSSKANYRAGIIDRNRFLQGVGGAIGGVESNEARKYISPADASVSTWIGYDTAQPFEISYYTQGQNLAALLELSILQDSNGKYGLDDAMRALYKDFYMRGKGYSTEDFLAIINRLTKSDYTKFFRKYINGVDVPPYNDILGYAGYQLDAEGLKEKRYRIVEVANPTPAQLRLREVWLKTGGQ
jgi:predicted metalloprotease with PDZ domain